MPSDPRRELALAALAQPIAEFRAVVEGAIVQGARFLAEQHATGAERAERAAATLGRFAEGRIDPARFAALFPAAVAAAPDALAALMRALIVLRDVRDGGDAMFVVDVPRGRRVSLDLDSALAAAGRAFGAVVLAEFVRGGQYEPSHERLLQPHDFISWNRKERRFAPPLVVLVDGADLHGAALAGFADGREKIVVVVRGECPPAPLARCITPGTLVIQTVSGAGLERIASFDGPAVAAIVPEGAAVFTHDPAAGKEPWQRLTVAQLPAAPRKGVGGQSAWQMGQDLAVLADLATTPFKVPAAAGSAPAAALGSADAADKLAAWLLSQSGLQGGAA